MSRDGAGTYSLYTGTTATVGETITDTKWNNAFNDLASAMTQSLSKDGQTQWTGNQNAGGVKITNLGNGSASGDAVNFSQLQGGYGQWKIGSTTRDLTAAAGTQVITGVGFQPRRVDFMLSDNVSATSAWSNGWDDGAAAMCMYQSTAAPVSGASLTRSLYYIYAGGATYQRAYITAFGPDGFTLTWEKGGSPSGTAGIIYRAWR